MDTDIDDESLLPDIPPRKVGKVQSQKEHVPATIFDEEAKSARQGRNSFARGGKNDENLRAQERRNIINIFNETLFQMDHNNYQISANNNDYSEIRSISDSIHDKQYHLLQAPKESCKQFLLEMDFSNSQIDALFRNEPQIVTIEEALQKFEKTDLGFQHKFVVGAQKLC